MYYGVHTPNFGDYGDPTLPIPLVHEAVGPGSPGITSGLRPGCPPLTWPWGALNGKAPRGGHMHNQSVSRRFVKGRS